MSHGRGAVATWWATGGTPVPRQVHHCFKLSGRCNLRGRNTCTPEELEQTRHVCVFQPFGGPMLIESNVHLPIVLAMLQSLMRVFKAPSGFEFSQELVRWLHFVAGITWIGLL